MSTVHYGNPAYPLHEYAQPSTVFQADLAWSVLGRLTSAMVLWDQASWRDPNREIAITDEEVEMLHEEFNPASRCNTSMCFAGMVVDLTGGSWLFGEKEFDADDKVTRDALFIGNDELDTVMVPDSWDVEDSESLESIRKYLLDRRSYWAGDDPSKDEVTLKLIELLDKHDEGTVGITAARYANQILGTNLSEAYNVSNGVADIAYHIAAAENESTGEPLLDILRNRCSVLIARMRKTQRRYIDLADRARRNDGAYVYRYEIQIGKIEEQIERLKMMIRAEEKAAESNG